MPFDPTKPAKLVEEGAGFDPSKPATLVSAGDAPSAAPSFLEEAGGRVKAFFDRPIIGPHPIEDVKESVKGIGRSLLEANDFASRAILHPIDTFGGGKAGAVVREGMRGVNSNIPFANLAIQHAGGAPEVSPEDAAKAPGAQALGAVAGAPVAAAEVAIAARGAGAAGRVLGRIGAGAEERGVTRSLERLEERTNKGTRERLDDDRVDDLVRREPEIKKAAGNDEKLTKKLDAVRAKASAELGHIYSSAAPEVDLARPVMKMDAKIAELAAGDVEERAAAKALQGVRDEFNNAMGTREAVSPRELRNEQSAYQKAGYGKNPQGDPDVGARIRAHREASKAIGDSVYEHVTGMDYDAARAAAAADPDSLAARLLKANDTINATNKIEAGIADRAKRVQPKSGIVGKAQKLAHAISHPTSLIPAAADVGARTVDAALSRGAGAASGGLGAFGEGAGQLAPAAAVPRSGPDAMLEQLIARADSGDPDAAAKLDAVSAAPIVAARVSAIRRKLGTP